MSVGLTGMWAPLEGDKRKADDDDAAERDTMQLEMPAASAGRGEQPGSPMRCAAAVWPGAAAVFIQGGKSGGVEVLDVAAAGGTVAAALSDGTVHLFSAGGDGKTLTANGTLRGHGGPVTAVAFATPALLLSIAADGVQELELPAGGGQVTQPTAKWRDPGGGELYCAAVSPDCRILAAGGEGRLLLFDRRTGKLLASFDETHREAVAQVAFAPSRPATLVSASDDGLVSVFDFSERVDEDDSWRAALNLDGAVAKMGFYGESSGKLWMASQLAGLHLWEWAAACAEDAPGGEGTLADIQDAREPLAAAVAAAAPGNGGDAAAQPPAAFDYLLGCHCDAASGELLLAAGSNSGAAAVFPVREPTGGEPAGFGPPAAWMSGSHTEIVRGLDWLDSPAGAVVTGGEDGQLCLWAAAGAAGGNVAAEELRARKRRK